MARIRSIKPEFWKSEAIAVHSYRARLTFIGLWTYVDDNGVGIDNEKLIAAELFALEEDPRETLANVREDLASLAEAGRIVRYTVGGKGYLAIVNWREHQKIDRPGKSRYPEPDDPSAVILTSENTEQRTEFARPSRESRETVARVSRPDQGAGSREQGSREQGVPPTAGASQRRDASLDDSEPTAQSIISEYLDRCRKRPPTQVIGQVGKAVKAMLAEGIDPDDIRRGIAVWMTKGLHPSTLPSVVNEVMNSKPAATAPSAPAAIPRSEQCGEHRGQPARNCGLCRADAKAKVAVA